MIMNLHDDVGTLRNRTRIVLRNRCRHGARSPATDERGARNSGAAETGIAAVVAAVIALRAHALPGPAGRVDKDQSVMHDAAIVRPELQSTHICVLIETQRQKKTSKLIGPVGGERKLRRHG